MTTRVKLESGLLDRRPGGNYTTWVPNWASIVVPLRFRVARGTAFYDVGGLVRVIGTTDRWLQ